MAIQTIALIVFIVSMSTSYQATGQANAAALWSLSALTKKMESYTDVKPVGLRNTTYFSQKITTKKL